MEVTITLILVLQCRGLSWVGHAQQIFNVLTSTRGVLKDRAPVLTASTRVAVDVVSLKKKQ